MKVRAKDPSSPIILPTPNGTGSFIITNSWIKVPKEMEDYFRSCEKVLEIDEETVISEVKEAVKEIVTKKKR